MTESYGFFASATGDQRLITQTTLAQVFKTIIRNGVHNAIGGSCQVQPSIPQAMSVTVSTGFAAVEGYWYYNDAVKTMQLAAADPSSPRIDRAIIRLDRLAERTITAMILTGTPSANPTAPTMTRTDSVYDLGIATIAVPAGATVAGTITDTRTLAESCGYMEPWIVTERSFYPTASVGMNGQKIVNCAPPSAEYDVATKGYVDWLAQWAAGYNTSTFFAGDMIDMAGHMGHLDDLGESPNGRHVYGRGTPVDWLLCNGAEVKKVDYPDLWAALDDGVSGHYGVPVGGSSYFKLPQMTGNVTGYHYYSGGGNFGVLGSVYPPSSLHAETGTGDHNVPQWCVVGGKLIKART